jgi:hypothetical protein
VLIGSEQLVYVLVTDKRLRYDHGKSRIVYTGTTRNGSARVAQSVATQAETILALHGVHAFHASILTCKPRQRLRTWLKLERALPVCFLEQFGDVQECNRHGGKMKPGDAFDYFSKVRVVELIQELS